MCSGSAQGSDHTSAGKQEKVNHFPKSPQLLTILFWDIPQGQSRYPARKDNFVLFIKQSCCQILPICHYLLPLPQWSLKKRWRLYPTRSLMMPLLRCVGVVLGSLQIFFSFLYLTISSVGFSSSCLLLRTALARLCILFLSHLVVCQKAARRHSSQKP